MKISSYTQILVLVCLGAALITFMLINIQFNQYERANKHQQAIQSYQNDINISQTMLRQWFTTIDLYYTDHQTYLAKGIASQTQQILKSLDRIAKGSQQIESIEELQQRIVTEARHIEDIAFRQKKSQVAWKQHLEKSDANTQQISKLFGNLGHKINQQYESASLAALNEKQQLKVQATLLFISFIATVIAAAYQTSRTLIKPLEKLTELANIDPTTKLKSTFALTRGPKEILMLANSFQKLYGQIASKMEEALISQAAQQQAQKRLSELVDNVPLAIITLDVEGYISSFNPATLELFKLKPEQLEHKKITELVPLLNINGGLFKQILNTGIDIELDAVVGKSLKPIELICAEFEYQTEHENISQYTIILHDISIRKWNEERVRQLNQKLINTSRQAGIAEIATSILHSVGNVLNSVNTSVSILQQGIENDKIIGIIKAADMFKQQGAQAFSVGGKGPQLITYLYALAEQQELNSKKNLKEVASLKQNVHHIAEIVSAQQKFSGKSGITEQLDISELIEEAININVVSFENNKVSVERNYLSPLHINGDRSKIIQILVNLIRNANEAMINNSKDTAKLFIKAHIKDNILTISIKDTGHGIEKVNMANMFRYGFTTKQDGHGFGLHSCALAAKEMFGALTVNSEGNNKGAEFKLVLPTDPSIHERNQIKTIMKDNMENIDD